MRDDIIRCLTRPDVNFCYVNQTWGKPEKTATSEGFPDMLVDCNGYTEKWELKVPELHINGKLVRRAGKLSLAQEEHARRAAKCGVRVYVIQTFEGAQERIAFLRSLPPSPAGCP
jgi:hypothetical protein